MRRRQLGALSVPAVGFGAMMPSAGLYGPVEPERAEATLLHAIDAGASLIDASDGYGSNGRRQPALVTA